MPSSSPAILMTDPAHFDVRYAINPWMRPSEWGLDELGHRRAARIAWRSLRDALEDAGARTEVLAGAAGWPDMVFPANAAVVLDGRALLARFRCHERRGEEPYFRSGFQALQQRGLIAEVLELPEGMVQEGAGDCIWDASRRMFWAGFGPRSDAAAAREAAHVFGREVAPLELATARYYHLDTCFCPLAGGEILYFPPAFTADALHRIRERVAPELLIEAEPDEAAAFCVNAVSIDHKVIMAEAPPRLSAVLAERGYRVAEVDLSPFILSGGGAFCMTLRLDLTSGQAAAQPLRQGAFQ
jgi:N-dimethylarginine dimethylaminohydrolase